MTYPFSCEQHAFRMIYYVVLFELEAHLCLWDEDIQCDIILNVDVHHAAVLAVASDGRLRGTRNPLAFNCLRFPSEKNDMNNEI